MRNSLLGITLLLSMVLAPRNVYAQGDRIYLERVCPGLDTQEAGPLVSAIMSALIPRIVGGGLNVLAGKLAAAAKPEQTVATAAVGDYLYEYAISNSGQVNALRIGEGRMLLAHGCLVYASALVDAKEKWPTKKHSCGPNEILSPLRNYGAAGGKTCDLLDYMLKKGYDPERPPRTLLVARIEVSKDQTAFRLEPNYLFFAASPDEDEKEVSAKKRKLAFSFSFSRPDPSEATGRKVFATPIIEFTDVAPGVVKKRRNGRRFEEINIYGHEDVKHRTSQWFAVPDASDSVAALVTQDQSIQTSFRSNIASAYQAYSRALHHKQVVASFGWDANLAACPNFALDYFKASSPPQGQALCETHDDSAKWLQDLRAHQAAVWSIEQKTSNLEDALKSEKNDVAKGHLRASRSQCNVAKTSRELSAGFASACHKIHANDDKREILDKLLTFAEPMDVSLTVVEDYKKPFLKFFADILGDESLRTELTGAVTASIDPAKRAEVAEKKATARREAVSAYETAVVDAQKKEVDYEAIDGAKEPFKKRKAEIDMRVSKLKANRLADELDLALPFPAVGTQF